MTRKIPAKELRKIAMVLPRKERERFLQESFTPEQLEQRIGAAKERMKQDLIFGIPWAVAYAASLWFFQFHYTTIILLLLGVAYFTYTFFTTGSYGLNRKRVKAYRRLLEQLK